MAKDSHWRNYLGVHSLNPDQVFFSTQKLFQTENWNFRPQGDCRLPHVSATRENFNVFNMLDIEKIAKF